MNIYFLFLSVAKHAGISVLIGLLLLGTKSFFQEQSDKIITGTWVIKVTELKFEVMCDLRGHLEAATASEATKMAVRSKMHMDVRLLISNLRSNLTSQAI